MQPYPLDVDEVATVGSSLTRLDKFSSRMHRLGILLKRCWWFVLLCACAAICFEVAQLTGESVRYSSAGMITADQPLSGRPNSAGTISSLENDIEIIRSSEIQNRARAKVQSLHPDITQDFVSIEVSNPRGSMMLNFLAEGSYAKYTQLYLQATMEEFLARKKEKQRDAQQNESNQLLQIVTKQENDMKEVQALISKLQISNPEIPLADGKNYALEELRELQGNLKKWRAEKTLIDRLKLEDDIQRRERLASTESNVPLTPEEREAIGVAEVEKQFVEKFNRVQSLAASMQSLLKIYREGHPEVLKLRAELETEISLLKNFETRSKALAEVRRLSLNSKIESAEKDEPILVQKSLETTAKLNELAALHDQYAKTQQRFSQTFESLTEADQRARQTPIEIMSILEPATEAAKKEPEYWWRIVSWGVFGVVVGLFLLFLMDMLDDRINSFSEFQTHFPYLPVLGQIPETSFKDESPMVRPNDDRHLYVESFRTVRSSILFKDWGPVAPKTLLVTSSVPNEGKTTVVINLAVTMAVAGARILLVDVDLRRGGLNELLGAPAKPGFSDVFTNQRNWRDLVLTTSVKNLYFIPRGDSLDQTSEFFLREETTNFLKESREEFDYVILDSAPVLVADDTPSIAPKLDAVLMVLRMSSVTARLVTKTFRLLEDRQVTIGGVILNRARANLKEYSYYNYASYYTVQPATPKPADAVAET